MRRKAERILNIVRTAALIIRHTAYFRKLNTSEFFKLNEYTIYENIIEVLSHF